MGRLITRRDQFVHDAGMTVTQAEGGGYTFTVTGDHYKDVPHLCIAIWDLYTVLDEFDTAFTQFVNNSNSNFQQIDASFTNMGQAMDANFKAVDTKFAAVESKIESIAKQMSNANDVLDASIRKLAKTVARKFGEDK